MRQELQDQLFKNYPLIFSEKDLPETQTCMCWGIECGDGWYDLIDRLCRFLQWHTDKNTYPQVTASQVKEKFGGLCFYVSFNTVRTDGKDCNNNFEYLQGAIDFAETMSYSICDVCGKPGKANSKGWISTRCEEHSPRN